VFVSLIYKELTIVYVTFSFDIIHNVGGV